MHGGISTEMYIRTPSTVPAEISRRFLELFFLQGRLLGFLGKFLQDFFLRFKVFPGICASIPSQGFHQGFFQELTFVFQELLLHPFRKSYQIFFSGMLAEISQGFSPGIFPIITLEKKNGGKKHGRFLPETSRGIPVAVVKQSQQYCRDPAA